MLFLTRFRPNRFCKSLELAEISPPAWGWPVSPTTAMLSLSDFPTRVGMARRIGAGIVWE